MPANNRLRALTAVRKKVNWETEGIKREHMQMRQIIADTEEERRVRENERDAVDRRIRATYSADKMLDPDLIERLIEYRENVVNMLGLIEQELREQYQQAERCRERLTQFNRRLSRLEDRIAQLEAEALAACTRKRELETEELFLLRARSNNYR